MPTNNLTEEDQDQGSEVYVWQSNNGCDLCQSLDGMEFEVEPDRPHKFCQCTIYKVRQGDGTCRGELEYTIEHTGNDHSRASGGGRPSAGDTFDVSFDYQIRCEDGTVIEGEITVQVDYDLLYAYNSSVFKNYDYEISEDEFWGQIYDDVLSNIDNIAASECPSCSQPLLA